MQYDALNFFTPAFPLAGRVVSRSRSRAALPDRPLRRAMPISGRSAARRTASAGECGRARLSEPAAAPPEAVGRVSAQRS